MISGCYFKFTSEFHGERISKITATIAHFGKIIFCVKLANITVCAPFEPNKLGIVK